MSTKDFRERLARVWWAWVHNCVAHGLEGWHDIVSLGGETPRWLCRFHDYTAAKAWPEEEK